MDLYLKLLLIAISLYGIASTVINWRDRIKERNIRNELVMLVISTIHNGNLDEEAEKKAKGKLKSINSRMNGKREGDE